MIWYVAWYHKDNPDYRGQIKEICSSFNYKEIYAKAQEIANRLNVVVTIRCEKGMRLWFRHIEPCI